MAGEELRFANDARAALEGATARGAWLLIFIILLMFGAFAGWAAWAEVEQTTSGEGRVIPSSQVQRVESLEPGLVAEIMVSAGDLVEAGQPLVRIDDTGSASRLGELRQRQVALASELERLNAQSRGDSTFAPPPDAEGAVLQSYADQVAVFNAQRRQLDEQIRIRRQQLVQSRQNVAEAEASAEKQAATLELVDRELVLTRNLFKKKAVPEIDLLRIERVASELRGDLKIWEAARIRLVSEVDEAEALLEAEQQRFSTQVQDRLSKVRSELAVVDESLRAAADRVRRAVLPSPVSGVVNKVNVASIGEVIQAGASVVEIVPLDDKLLIETRIRPQDIAFIRPGLPATIRISAYDYTRFGSLSGVVERIGADTITDENRQTFYQVVIRTDDANTAKVPDITIIPGMIATVDIRTGARTVLSYLLKPVIAMRDSALREPQ